MYAHSLALGDHLLFRWSWRDDGDGLLLHGEMDVQLGFCWSSIGFNPYSGGMINADYIMGGSEEEGGEPTLQQSVPNMLLFTGMSS
jgi:hypothetical protein